MEISEIRIKQTILGWQYELWQGNKLDVGGLLVYAGSDSRDYSSPERAFLEAMDHKKSMEAECK
jgi:hypothetical protein